MRQKTMRADDLVAGYGKKLKGAKIITEPIGYWPGGKCVVSKVGNKCDPNIVMFVRHVSEHIMRDLDVEEMGVFGYEEVTLLSLGVRG